MGKKVACCSGNRLCIEKLSRLICVNFSYRCYELTFLPKTCFPCGFNLAQSLPQFFFCMLQVTDKVLFSSKNNTWQIKKRKTLGRFFFQHLLLKHVPSGVQYFFLLITKGASLFLFNQTMASICDSKAKVLNVKTQITQEA